MTRNFEILSRCPLFFDVHEHDFEAMLSCLSPKTVEVSKGEAVFLEGTPAEYVGIVLSGAVQVIREDYYGNRSVLTMAEPGDLFAEVFSCAGLDAMPVSVFAVKQSRILLLNCKRVLTVCSNSCPFHHQLVTNLLKIVARKNLALNQKIHFMSRRTTKEKVMAYLSEQAKRQNSAQFIIPYDRQALADFLGVERSAMSAEISKLKKSGVIDCKGSYFHIKSSTF